MTTHLPSPDEPSLSTTHVGEGPPELVSSQLFQPPSTTPSDQAEESFYTFEDEPFDLMGTPWVAPFELSNEMPGLSAQAQPSSQATAIPAAPAPIKQPGKKRLFSLPMIAIFVCVAILVGMLVRMAQVQLTPSLQSYPTGRAPPDRSLSATGDDAILAVLDADRTRAGTESGTAIIARLGTTAIARWMERCRSYDGR